jgi:energy-coupling factor transporter ATP-binding protein EcfA2
VTSQYVLHGLRVESDISLPEPERNFAGTPDLVVRRGEARATDSVCDALIDLRFEQDGTVYYEAFRENETHWCIRAPNLFTLRLVGTEATAIPHPGVEEALVPMMVAGMSTAFALTLQGCLVLHASAIEADGRALALCAPSGCGKSTLAALAAAAGRPLVADDLLRVGFDDACPSVYRGASEIRLRAGAAALVDRWPERNRVTFDGRTAVAPPRTAADELPLAAVVLPLLDPARDEVTVERLRASEAFGALLACPRLLGWRYRPVITRQFDQLTALATRVPIVVAWVPWRTPAQPVIGASLVDRVVEAIG